MPEGKREKRESMNKDTEWRKEQGKSTAVEAGERRRDFGQDISAEEQREKRRDNDGRRSFSPSSSLTNKRSTDLSLASKEGDSPNRPGVMGDSGAEFELSRLKANAESLAGCLHSVLQKISELEQAEGVVEEGEDQPLLQQVSQSLNRRILEAERVIQHSSMYVKRRMRQREREKE